MASDGGGGGGGEVSVASDPDFAAVCSFLQVFGPACALDALSISDLQRILEDTQEVSDALRDLHLKLLRRALKSVQPERWERGLVKFCHQLRLHKEAWELERFSYKKASTRVKITILKVLLEYQFTCHTKFKNSVNARESSELRLEPVGRDRGGRVYWLHTDAEANLRLYREDQDEETWSLIARDREGLVKVINQLKSGEETSTVDESLLNEDSNSLETSLSAEKTKAEDNEDSNEEFLSPESESDHESDSNAEHNKDKEENSTTSTNTECKTKEDLDLKESSNNKPISTDNNNDNLSKPDTETESLDKASDPEQTLEETQVSALDEKPETNDCTKDAEEETAKESENASENNPDGTVGPAIEEPVMVVTGEGNGADCESIDCGTWDEISEPVMYFWGEGWGSACDTGNPGETATQINCEDKISNADPPDNDEVGVVDKESTENAIAANNGAVSSDVDSNTSSSKKQMNTLENCIDKLKNDHALAPQSVAKRMLQENCQVSEQKQVESTPKKPCIWNVESIVKKSESSDDGCSEQKIKESKSANEANCKSEENGCNVEEKPDKPVINSASNSSIDNCSEKQLASNGDENSEGKTKDETSIGKTKDETSINSSSDNSKPNSELSDKKNIVEKRKSSLSSEDDKRNKISESEENCSTSNKKQSGKHKAKPRSKGNAKTVCKPDVESLPSKKLRLDSSTDDCDKETPEKSITEDGPNSKVEKDGASSEQESHSVSRKNSIPTSSTEDIAANQLDDSGIVPKKCRVENVSNDVEKDDNDVEASGKEELEKSKEQTPQRVTKKVRRGKYRRRLLKKPVAKRTEAPAETPAETPADSDSDKNLDEIANKHKEETSSGAAGPSVKNAPLKQGLQPEKRKRTRNKVESVSEEENEETVMGKRLKMKPRKILLSSRKKVEAKLNNLKDSSEESEEAEVTPKKGKAKRNSSPKKESKEKSVKKVKKKPAADGKSKKSRTGTAPEAEEDISPVRQSRRIAQLKIREEAERRQMEEVALRELKMKHKKKSAGDGEEEWKASGGEASSASEQQAVRGRARRTDKWPPSDSSAPASDTDTDEPLFEREYEEPDLVFKSDHEFSPESDLEDGETGEPLKRARTLKQEAEGFCVRCGRGDQPEWILLCDDCDAGYHASCLKPVLFLVPDGDWFCPPCQHERLIKSLEVELVKYDELAKVAEGKMSKRKSLELAAQKEAEENKAKKSAEESEESSSEWSSSDEGTVYRLRERRQLPVSLRAQEYDRLMSSAIKEEYKEPTSSAGNQGRGKDISTIIEAAEEEKQKAELEAAQQSGGGEGGGGGGGEGGKRVKPRRPRRKPRKLNSLEVVSEDDDDIDEDFKETGWETSSESISSDAERDTNTESHSSDSLPIRRSGRDAKKSRKKLVESPELKKKKGVFEDTSSESSGAKDWANKKKPSSKKRYDKTFPKKVKKKKGLKQYDADGNVIKQRVKYGGLTGSEGSNDWSPKHRTRQKKINYTEMPNTESEDEMHKPSGKHMPDSSDEFKLDDSEQSSDSDSERKRKRRPSEEEREPPSIDETKVNTLRELIKKTAVVPLHKLPEDVTKAKTEALEAQLNARVEAAVGTATPSRPSRGKGSRGGRGSRGPRGGGSRPAGSKTPGPSAATDETQSNLVGLKIKDLSQTADGPPRPSQVERERKRVEREARIAEKEARKLDRIKKKEEKEQLKEQKAKEREEKRLAKMALMESKKQRKEKFEGLPVPIPISGYGNPGARPTGAPPPAPPPGRSPHDMRHPGMPMNINQQFADYQRMRHPSVGGGGGYEGGGGGDGRRGGAGPPPRLQVRPELRAMRPDLANVRAPPPPAPGSAPHYHHPHHLMQRDADRRGDPALREGTLSVAGSPQPFKPATDPPSIITRMPHMIPPQYRGAAMYVAGSPYGPPPHGARPPHMMYMHQPHPLDPSPSGGGPINMNSRPFPSGYYPRGYPPPRFPAEPPHHAGHTSTPPPSEPKIKSEIKTEPEATSSPSSSPARLSSPPQDEPARPHPKIKHTESKERARSTAAARYPHGPYAPQYGPYGPYAPPGPEGYPGAMHPMQVPPPRPMHPTPPPGSHPAHRMPPHHSGPPPPPSHHPGQHHHTPPPMRHGPPPHHVPSPHHSARPPMHHPHPSGLAAHQAHPPGGPVHQQHPPGVPSHQQHPSGAPSHQQHPPGVSAHQQHPPGVSAHQQHPSGASAHQQHPLGAAAHHQHPPGASAHQQHPPGSSTHLQHPPGASAHQQHPQTAPSHQQHPPGAPAHHQHPPGAPTHQQHPPGTPTHQQHPPGASAHQSRPSGGPTHQPHPPSSPLTPLHSTPPPAMSRHTPEVIHHPTKMSAPLPTDSINLVSHNRLQSSPPPVVQRLGAPLPMHGSPETDGETPSHPVALTVSSAASDTQLTPMESVSSKVTVLGSSEAEGAAPSVREPGGAASGGDCPPTSEGGAGPGAGVAREEEGGVFGGLVSYFSSQQEDDIDG